MKISIVYPAVFPVVGYGGTERAIWWLAKALAERGHQICLCALPGSSNPFGSVHAMDFTGDWQQQLPKADLHHFFSTPPKEPSSPYLVSIEGNAKDGEVFYPNTSFVSANHAERHGGQYFVYNGIDMDEYPLAPRRDEHWIFLAKASWRVKNVRGAIRAARRAGVPLDVVGGGVGWWPRWRGVQWRGMLGGEKKLRAIQGASGLLFPVKWHEPFGIAVIEAMALGAPVVATPYGSLPELVGPEVGRLGTTLESWEQGIRDCKAIDPLVCRQWVEKRFTHRHMAEGYEKLYRKVLAGERLHSQSLKVVGDQGTILE